MGAPQIPTTLAATIRRRIAEDPSLSRRKLATELGVNQTTIGNVLNRTELDQWKAQFHDLLMEAYAPAKVSPVIPIKFPCTVIFMDDLHIPFTDTDYVEKVVEREGGADLLITMELLNLDGFSRFTQTYRSNTGAEFAGGVGILNYLKKRFPRLVIGTSNHMERINRAIRAIMSTEQAIFMTQNLRTVLDDLIGKDKKITRIPSPLLQVGDACFAHFDDYLTTPGATPERIADYCATHYDVLGLTFPRAVYHGHTHRVSKTPWARHLGYVFETGCNCFIQPYARFGTKRGAAGSRYRMAAGYGRAVFDADGRIDLSKSEAVHLGWAKCPEMD